MSKKTKENTPRLKATGSLAKPLLPYDGRQYPSEGEKLQGILGSFSSHAARYKREQQIAKLPEVISALGLDIAEKNLGLNLILSLCARLFPVGFKENPRGRRRENPEKKNDAAFKMVHLYQIGMLVRGRPLPTLGASADALALKMEKLRKNPDLQARVDDALKAAILEALETGVTARSIKRKTFNSSEKLKREKVGLEAYQLGLNNALYPLDDVAADLGTVSIIGTTEEAKPDGFNAIGLPLRGKHTWGSAVADRLEAAGCRCFLYHPFLLTSTARSHLAAARAAYPGQCLIFSRADSCDKGNRLSGAFQKAGVSVPVLDDGFDGLTPNGPGVCLALPENAAPRELLKFYDPSAPGPRYGLLFGLRLSDFAHNGILALSEPAS